MVERFVSFGPSAVPELAQALLPKSSDRSREVAQAALVRLAEPALKWSQQDGTEVGLRVAVLLALESRAVREAERALVAQLPRQRPWFTATLARRPPSEQENPALAVFRLVGRDGAGEVAPLCSLLDGPARRDWRLAENVASALGWIGTPDATPCLLRALDIPSWRVTQAALTSLARIGPEAPGASSVVLGLATTHWSQRIRWRAVIALRFLREGRARDEAAAVARELARGGTYRSYLSSPAAKQEPVTAAFAQVPPLDSPLDGDVPACAAGRKRHRAWSGEGTNAALVPLASPAAASRARSAASAAGRIKLEALGLGFDVPLVQAARDAMTTPVGQVVATCAAERGGGLVLVTPSGEARALQAGCFVRIVSTPEGLLAVEGTTHKNLGKLWRLELREGRVLLEPWVDLPGEPLAFAIAPSGAASRLLVATTHGDLTLDAQGHAVAGDCAPP
jgi:hypothetical protein